ncbi:MAG: Gfo/Idh/MocA family oxidoreductase, partial [Crenarchaeota archaeon]|nr:Gfo/Idh/MocA family oxidoreductase [Thermoproteota archaeon]
MKKTGLLGCGAIGSLIAKAIDEGIINAELTYVYDINKEAAFKLVDKLRRKPKISNGIDEMLKDESVRIIVEAASDEAVAKYLKPIIEAGKEVLVMSIGGLLLPETKRIY